MPGARQPFTFAVIAVLLSAFPVHAQAPRGALRVGTWAVGASGEMLWSGERSGDPDVDAGFDASVERRVRRIGKRDVLGIRVQLGRGAGDGRDDGLGYTRLLAGVIRHRCFREDECYGEEGYAPYFVGGGGVYLLTPSGATPPSVPDGASLPAGRRTRPSVFGGLGLDRTLGTRRASLRMEMRVYSIGAELQTAVSLGVQVHMR